MKYNWKAASYISACKHGICLCLWSMCTLLDGRYHFQVLSTEVVSFPSGIHWSGIFFIWYPALLVCVLCWLLDVLILIELMNEWIGPRSLLLLDRTNELPPYKIIMRLKSLSHKSHGHLEIANKCPCKPTTSHIRRNENIKWKVSPAGLGREQKVVYKMKIEHCLDPVVSMKQNIKWMAWPAWSPNWILKKYKI